jgi:hypothetical protein
MSHENKIWYNNIQEFITTKNYFVILPIGEMSLEDKLNAIVRFFIYLGILLSLIRGDYRYLFFALIAGIISIVIYNSEILRQNNVRDVLEKENLDIINNKVCTRVTLENPFMNPSIADMTYNPDRPEACDITEEKIQDKIDDKFNARIFRDVNDIYNKHASQRQFYTLPSTTIPNNQGGFANWLYNRGPSCKQGNEDQCWRNISAMGVLGGGGHPGKSGSST